MSTNVPSLSEAKKKDLILKFITYIFSIGLSILILLPFVFLLKEIFGDETYIRPGPGGTFEIIRVPRKGIITFKEILGLFNEWSFVPLKNSLIVSVTSTFLNIYFSALTAYAITAYKWKLREVFEKGIIITMMIPTTVASLGFIQLTYKFGLINKLFILIVPALATPLTVFFMRMYLKATFSQEILEAARIDGAGEFRIFNQIMLPIMKPAIATQTIFCFVSSWSEVWVPSIILLDDKKKTLSIFNSAKVLAPPGGIELMMVIPPILVYIFCSKHIVEGVALGSVKN